MNTEFMNDKTDFLSHRKHCSWTVFIVPRGAPIRKVKIERLPDYQRPVSNYQESTELSS